MRYPAYAVALWLLGAFSAVVLTIRLIIDQRAKRPRIKLALLDCGYAFLETAPTKTYVTVRVRVEHSSGPATQIVRGLWDDHPHGGLVNTRIPHLILVEPDAAILRARLEHILADGTWLEIRTDFHVATNSLHFAAGGALRGTFTIECTRNCRASINCTAQQLGKK
jgi:hypothetical protein